MKKILVLLLCLFLVGCSSKPIDIEKSDAIEFKEIYESLNGQSDEDGIAYTTIEISEDNPMIISSNEEILEVLDNSGIILFAFPECPWCRLCLPVVLDAAKNNGIGKIYYLNNLNERNKYEVIDNQLVETEKGTEEYYQILEKLGDKATGYYFEDFDNETIKRVYFPTVVVIKNGEVLLLQSSCMDSHTDPYIPFTSEEYQELYNIYSEGFNKYKNTCSLNQAC